MIVPDLNLLLYAVHRESPMHPRASRWLKDLLNGDEPVGMPWAVSLGFVRLTTSKRVFTTALDTAKALEIVDQWYARRIVTPLEPLADHWSLVRGLLTEAGTAGNLTTDAHLAALCIERGATLHTADADFGRFDGLRWMNPLTA